MASWQSRLFYFMMRNRHIMKFNLKKEQWDMNTSMEGFRKQCEEGARKAGGLPQDVCVLPVEIEGLPAGLAAEWIYPAALQKEHLVEGPVIFYTHGGAYVSGSCSDHRGILAKMVQRCGIPVLLYEYRLAPEHPFPAALEDTMAAYRWLLARGAAPQRTVIFGESAGGGLCLATLLAIKEQGLPLPAAGVALSPWTDLTLSGESYRTNRMSCMSPLDMSKICRVHYCGTHDPASPLISPLFGDLHGLPPLLIYVGNDETMRDDSIMFVEKARQAGIEVQSKVEMGMGHCYPLMAPLFPEATQAMQEICAFMQRQTDV